MKVATQEQRDNPKRSARLRKKLRVTEFTEYMVETSVKFSRENFEFGFDGDSVDKIIDELHQPEICFLDAIAVHPCEIDGKEGHEVILVAQSYTNERSQESTEIMRPKIQAYFEAWQGATDLKVGEVENGWYD